MTPEEKEPSVELGFSPAHARSDEGWRAVGNTLYLPDGTYIVFMGHKVGDGIGRPAPSVMADALQEAEDGG